MKLKVQNIVYETEDAVSLYFKNNSFFNKVKYKAGQFLTLNLMVNNQIEKRAYSLSSSPLTDNSLRVTIKKVKNGIVSNYIYNQVKVGDKIEIENPRGSFFIEPKATNKSKYVLFAGGSGITPILSITKSILKEEGQSEILLFFANRNEQSIIFKEELSSLQQMHANRIRIVNILEETFHSHLNNHVGNIRDEIIEKEFNEQHWSFESCSYFICGPAGYMEKVKEILLNKNVKGSNIRTELFTAPKIKFKNENRLSKVTIIHKDETRIVEIPGNKTILQTCLASNIQIPYSCKSGMCNTCKSLCIEGEIEMTEGHFLTDEEIQQGYVLNCISYPVSEKVILKIA